MPAIASAIAAFLLLAFELVRNDANVERITFDQIKEHHILISGLEIAYFCTDLIVNLDSKVAEDVRGIRRHTGTVTCDKSWCKSYRMCTRSEIPDGELIEITEKLSWSIILPVRKALGSYEFLSISACTGSLDKKMVLQQFKTDLGPRNRMVEYMKIYYPSDNTKSVEYYPGITGVLGKLYPCKFPEWKDRWDDGCPFVTSAAPATPRRKASRHGGRGPLPRATRPVVRPE